MKMEGIIKLEDVSIFFKKSYSSNWNQFIWLATCYSEVSYFLGRKNNCTIMLMLVAAKRVFCFLFALMWSHSDSTLY